MSICDPIRERFSLYLEGDLDPNEITTVESHLENWPGASPSSTSCESAFMNHLNGRMQNEEIVRQFDQ